MLKAEAIKLDINTPIKMRDGTVLYADVWRPDKPGKVPAILTRTPYNKNLQFPTRAGYMNPQRIARNGYAVVIQDVRGTGDSEGEANFWKQETEDGYDSVEGVASLPWCDGNVGMFGFSYFGYTQLAAAVARPPHLKAICPGMTLYIPRSFPYSLKGDTFKLLLHLGWCLQQTLGKLMRLNLPPQEMMAKLKQLITNVDTVKEQVKMLPVADIPAAKLVDAYGMMPAFLDISKHNDESYWGQAAGELNLDDINVPVFHFAGWYDTEMTPGLLADYHKLQDRKKNRLPANRLLIGPWIHSGEMINIVGQLDFGMVSNGALEDVTGRHLRWFDRWLKGKENALEKDAPVRIFIMGANVWRNEEEWPLARTKYQKFYLHSGGQANTSRGNGALAAAAPAEEQPDSFLYDPRNPAPSNEMGMGAYDQREVEKRPDVLVYSTPVLDKEIEVTGPVKLIVYASTTAVDTDFTGKLVDVWPEGPAYNVAEGIIRARFRHSADEPELLRPGEVYEYEIDLGSTGILFKAGHSIRLEVSSSYFPKWGRNLNTGANPGEDANPQIAAQTVYHDSKYASYILLPVIPQKTG
jgi:putative CocE/NonD family hydrolase